METTQMTTITTKNIDAVDENELAEDLDSFGDKLKLLSKVNLTFSKFI